MMIVNKLIIQAKIELRIGLIQLKLKDLNVRRTEFSVLKMKK